MANTLVQETELLLNESGASVWWGAQQVYDALNQSIQELSGHLRWELASTSFTVSTGTDIFAFDNSQIMIPQYFVSEGTKLFPTEQAELENWSRTWRLEPAGKPKWVVLWDASHFRVFPSPDQSYTFTLYGVPWLTEIDGSNTDITIDAMAKKAIVFRAVAHLLELTQPQLADTYMQESLENEKRYSTQIRNNLGSNIASLRPGVGWTIAQFGDIKIGRKY